MEYKCKVCGGELQFNPELGKLRCPFCGSEYEVDDDQHAHEHKSQHEHPDTHEQQSVQPQAMQEPACARWRQERS